MAEDKTTNDIVEEEEDIRHCCKNCEQQFNGNFCPSCGQSVKNYDKPLRFLFVDMAGNIFAFDTRFWLTIRRLLANPGKYESEFVAGKRRRYMPPFRLYVFVSFFFFILLGYATNKSVRQNKELIARTLLSENEGAQVPDVYILGKYLENKVSPEEVEKVTEILAKAKPDSVVARNEVKTLNLGLTVRNQELDIKEIASNPEMYLARFFKYLSWSFLLLMPVYGLLLWLFFNKSHKFFFAHFVLAISHHVLVFIAYGIVIVSGLLLPAVTNYLSNGFFFLLAVYFFIGALRMYKLRWYSVLLRLLAVVVIYFFISMFATVPVVIMALT